MTAIEQWNREVARLRAEGKAGDEIVEELATKQPDLHQRYIREWNAKHAARAAGKPM